MSENNLIYVRLTFSSNEPNNVFEHIENSVLVTNCESEIIYSNPAFTRSTGYTAEEVLGRNPDFLHSGRHEQQFFDDMWACIKKQGYWEGEIWNRKKSGEIFPEFLTISSLINEEKNLCNYVAIFSDITHLKQDMYKKLKHALYDPLTELPNRTLYHDRMQTALHSGKMDPTLKHAILFMDLDKFKQVNDTYGHLTGDRVLKLVGERLSSVLRFGDTVARIGGDEFTAILYGIKDKSDVDQLAKRMVEAIEKPFMVDGHEIHISISIGVSLYPADAHQIEDLLARADKAMYNAKKNQNKVQFFEKPV